MDVVVRDIFKEADKQLSHSPSKNKDKSGIEIQLLGQGKSQVEKLDQSKKQELENYLRALAEKQ